MFRGRALLAGLRLESLPARDLIDVTLAMMEQEVVDGEIVKVRDKIFATIASLPAEAASERARAMAAAAAEIDLRPAPGVAEEPLGVV